MNIFRLAADMLHLLSFIVMLYRMKTQRSCRGVSLKSQILFLTVFCCRYLVSTHAGAGRHRGGGWRREPRRCGPRDRESAPAVCRRGARRWRAVPLLATRARALRAGAVAAGAVEACARGRAAGRRGSAPLAHLKQADAFWCRLAAS